MNRRHHSSAWTTALVLAWAFVAYAPIAAGQAGAARTFSTPEDAAKELIRVAKTGTLQDLLALFGPDAQELVDNSDPVTARRNRQIFTVAAAERWHLVDQDANAKTLVVGNEDWPFPVPIVKEGTSWRFDAAAGKEEVLDRRIGRNELAVIETCRGYVTAQTRYAQQGHDGKPAGLYAQRFQSDAGKTNGLYWPTAKGQPRSPLGDLLAQAAEAERPVVAPGSPASTFQGYYFKILTAQGSSAAGGARNYIVNGELSRGFGLVAWPAEYGVTGVMTFIIDKDGALFEQDLGTRTDSVAKAMTAYNPDQSWQRVSE
jgi:hypothetical protein